MKRKLIIVGLVLALGALVLSRLASPVSGEARMILYQRHPWQH
jgi:hypothetical protein